MKNKKLQMILLSVGCVVFMGISIITMFSENIKIKPNKNEPTYVKTEFENNLSEAIDKLDKDETIDTDNLTEEDKMSLLLGEEGIEAEGIVKLGDKNNPEYPEDRSQVLYDDLIKKAQKADYVNILTTVEEKAKEYRFYEKYNWKISKVYMDALIMIETLTASQGVKGSMVNTMKDPQMYVIGTLMLAEEERRSIFKSTTSLSPIFDGPVTITEFEVLKEDSEDTIYKDMKNNLRSVSEYYKISLTVENNPLIAYVCKYANGTLEFYQLTKNGDYECNYKTVQYWIDMDEVFNPDNY